MLNKLDDNNLIVQNSSVHGKGLFSKINFYSGQTVTTILGEVINAEECIRREDDGNVYIFWKEDDIYVDVSNVSEIKFINHSCNYNCDVDEDANGNLILVAMRNIKVGEELTIDYGYEEIYENCSCSVCANKGGQNNF